MSERVARVRAEQRHQWERGSRVRIEAYLDRYPDLLDDDESALDLIYSEVLLREELGEVVRPDEYLGRFPQYAPRLARQFELHALVTGGGRDGGATGPAGAGSPLPDLPGYEIVRWVGAGSWGTVYEARQLSLGRRVAVKVHHAGGRAEPDDVLRREAAAVARFRHPNIVQVYDLGEVRGRAYAVMELVEGGSLAAALAARGPYPAADAARLLAAVARAVQHAHEQGIVHRDLKPANILLASDGTPKVTDFGLAKRLDGASSLTPGGGLVGTACYMAPEQAGGGSVGPAADVYALGAILHEVLTGRPPFEGADLWDVLRQVRDREPPPLPGRRVPRGIDAIRQVCLRKEPGRRYRSAGEVADDLERWLRGEPTAARPPSRLRRMWRAVPHRPLVAVAPVAVTLALAAAVVPAYRWYTDPLSRMGRALARGETVTLVGPAGLPSWYRWRQSGADLEVTDDGGRAASFRATRCSVLELVPDPGPGRYRFTAEVRHLESTEGAGAVGVFVGLESFGTDVGWRADRWYGVEYSDYLERARDTKTQVRRLEGVDHLPIAHPDGARPNPSKQGVWTEWYPAPDNAVRLPPWRVLTLTVGPDEVRAEWGAAGDAPRPLPVFRAAADRARRTASHRDFYERSAPTFRPPETGWSARRPVGVYARRAAVAFRNVVIEPLP